MATLITRLIILTSNKERNHIVGEREEGTGPHSAGHSISRSYWKHLKPNFKKWTKRGNNSWNLKYANDTSRNILLLSLIHCVSILPSASTNTCRLYRLHSNVVTSLWNVNTLSTSSACPSYVIMWSAICEQPLNVLYGTGFTLWYDIPKILKTKIGFQSKSKWPFIIAAALRLLWQISC